MRARLLGAALVAVVLGAGALLLTRGDDERDYGARFESARGLLVGNDVRVGGAVAGRVRAVRLAPDGTAEVRFTLDDDAARPRSDASAAILPVDLLGDVYLSVSPGTSGAALRGPIAPSRTTNAPRLDELLRTFTPHVRDALQGLIVEGGLALDARGGDLARTAVALRPALQATDRVTAELNGQNAALARLVPSAERAASQLAGRSDDVGPLIDDLARTVDTTASHRPALDATLRGLPRALDRARSTATRLDATARAARPLAVTLRDTAPTLASAVTELRPFLSRLRRTAAQLRPVVRSLRRTLTGGRTSLPQLSSALRTLIAATPDARKLVDTIEPAAPAIAKGFLENFPDQAAESGRQPGDPFADPKRRYWRGAAVASCELFGVPVKPGCLEDVLASFAGSTAKAKAPTRKAPSPAATRPASPAPAPAAATPATPTATAPAPLPVVPAVKKVLDDVGKAVSPPPDDDNAVKKTLDFLLKP